MFKIFTIASCLCLLMTINARVIDMYTTTTTDMWGNTRPSTSFTVPNRGPNGWDQVLGSATDQSISFNTQPILNVKPQGGDSIRDMNNQNRWSKTNMAGQISEQCMCPGHGIPCNCHSI